MTSSNISPHPEVNETKPDRSIADCYEIYPDGWLDSSWSEWLDGLEIKHVGDCKTIISRPVVDQSALYGLLLKIRDLNLKLLQVKKL
jgi:hypothetical protein